MDMNITNTISPKVSIKDHIELLRTKGLRITPIVTALLSRLACSHLVRTTSELKEDISEALGYDVGSPTVYRICERLASIGVLCSMHKSDGILRFFLCTKPRNENHQHFICTRCQKVQEVECAIDETIKEAVSHRIDGVIENNFIQLEGICGDCKK
jgi:Fur family transcriptional regulator, ferric uptake regulator